jgi:hypothetical protein
MVYIFGSTPLLPPPHYRILHLQWHSATVAAKYTHRNLIFKGIGYYVHVIDTIVCNSIMLSSLALCVGSERQYILI